MVDVNLSKAELMQIAERAGDLCPPLSGSGMTQDEMDGAWSNAVAEAAAEFGAFGRVLLLAKKTNEKMVWCFGHGELSTCPAGCEWEKRTEKEMRALNKKLKKARNTGDYDA